MWRLERKGTWPGRLPLDIHPLTDQWIAFP